MKTLCAVLQGLNPTVEAALVGGIATGVTALLALFGVALSLRSNRKNQREERYLNLKREVFLEASRSYSAAVHLLAGTWIAESLSSDRSQEISTAFGAAVGKVLLVGNDRSIKAWLRLQTEFAGILARLGVAGMQLQLAHRTFLEEKAQYEEQTATDDAKHKKAFDSLMALLDYYGELRTQIWKTVEETVKLLPLSTEATLAAKQELGIKVDADEFTKISAQTSEQASKILKSLMVGVNDKIISQLEALRAGKKSNAPDTPDEGKEITHTERESHTKRP